MFIGHSGRDVNVNGVRHDTNSRNKQHCGVNFIVNEGGATARDVLALIALLKMRAMESRGIELHTEVEIIGAD